MGWLFFEEGRWGLRRDEVGGRCIGDEVDGGDVWEY